MDVIRYYWILKPAANRDFVLFHNYHLQMESAPYSNYLNHRFEMHFLVHFEMLSIDVLNLRKLMELKYH